MSSISAHNPSSSTIKKERFDSGSRENEKKAYLDIIPALPILIADPLIPIRRLPIMSFLQETQRNLQPSQDLITRTDIPLLILILPSLGKLILLRLINRANRLVTLVTGKADLLGLRLGFVLLEVVLIVIVTVVEVVFVVLLVVAFPTEVGRLVVVVFVGLLLAEVFVVDGFAGAVDFVFVGLVAGVLWRVSG